MNAKIAQQIASRRNRQYAKLCTRCKDGQKAGYGPKRAVVFGSTVWIHDSVTACKAAELREKHWQEDHQAN
jgi:hypothetical protein